MEDTVILTQCLIKSKKVSTYNKPLYFYNYRENSISNNVDKVVEQAIHMQANMEIISMLLNSSSSIFKKEIECKFFL